MEAELSEAQAKMAEVADENFPHHAEGGWPSSSQLFHATQAATKERNGVPLQARRVTAGTPVPGGSNFPRAHSAS